MRIHFELDTNSESYFDDKVYLKDIFEASLVKLSLEGFCAYIRNLQKYGHDFKDIDDEIEKIRLNFLENCGGYLD